VPQDGVQRAAARWVEPFEAPDERDPNPMSGWVEPPCEWEPLPEDLGRIADAWRGRRGRPGRHGDGRYVVVYPPAPDAAEGKETEDRG
jgi:hypothetical protein